MACLSDIRALATLAVVGCATTVPPEPATPGSGYDAALLAADAPRATGTPDAPLAPGGADARPASGQPDAALPGRPDAALPARPDAAGSAPDAMATLDRADFAARCAAPGVVRCVGFDEAGDISGVFGDVHGTFPGD